MTAFAFLPVLDADAARRQVAYAVARRWCPIVEYADDPRTGLWSWWRLPWFDPPDPDEVVAAAAACAAAHPGATVRIAAHDPTGAPVYRLAFVTHRPR